MLINRLFLQLYFSVSILHYFVLAKTDLASMSMKCDEETVNLHMLRCYREHIDQHVDTSTGENAFFLDEHLLCRVYNSSSSYRQCLFSIFNRDEVCSKERFPFSFEYSKIYWKLVLSSCQLHSSSDPCYPSHLSQQTLLKCSYSFDDKFPTQCREFLQSVRCMSKHENDLIPVTSHRSDCSRRKAFYYYYGDLAARLQLSINVCEDPTGQLVSSPTTSI